MKTMTNAATVRQENQSVKQRIQQLLGWDDLKYAEYQQAMGYQYLETELGVDAQLMHALVKEKIYWSWWINHWIKRDIVFLEQFEAYRAFHLTDELYRIRHNPKTVQFKPQNTVMRHSYAKMIGQLIDQVHND